MRYALKVLKDYRNPGLFFHKGNLTGEMYLELLEGRVDPSFKGFNGNDQNPF